MSRGNNHFGIYTLIKNILAKLTLSALALFVGFAFVLFVNNHFSFLPPVELHDYSPAPPDPEMDNTEPLPEQPDTLPEDSSADEPEITAKSYLSTIPAFNDELIAKGYYLSDLPYGKNFILSKITPEIALPLYYSADSGVEESSPIPSLHPRMGFIVMQNSDLSFSLLDSNGSLICAMPEGSRLLSARDSEGNPVFEFPEGYMYYSHADGIFLPSSYNPALDVHGTVFDSPSYYDVPTEAVYRAHEGVSGSWGFKNSTDGRQIVSGIYNFAYQFSQGFGVVQNKNGRLTVHNANGYSRFTDHSFYMPDDNGISSLGFYTFDHGLMRVRDMKYDWTGKLLSEREFVLHLGNTEFFLPRDYKIESYFDGVFLLSKNGRYGYCNYLGEWIVQPIYTYASPFIEGLGVIGYSDGKKGVVDDSGNFVVPLVFDEITGCSGGVMTLYSEDAGWYIVNKIKTDIPDLPIDTKPIPTTPPEDVTVQDDFVSEIAGKLPYSISYFAEQASYNYTMWLYNSSNKANNNETLYDSMFINTFAPYSPTYNAERASYDYTMWLFDSEKTANENAAYESLFINTFAPYSPSYNAERASYDYTMWLFDSEKTANENAAYESLFINTFAPYSPSYNAERASYDYTMWLFDSEKTAKENAIYESLFINTFAPYLPTYNAERASYDYTIWLYSQQ